MSLLHYMDFLATWCKMPEQRYKHIKMYQLKLIY